MNDDSKERRAQQIVVRSWRLVMDKLDRRIYTIGEYRLTVLIPQGIPVRGALYFFALLCCLLVLKALPVVGLLVGLMPVWGWLLFPGFGAYALSQFEVGGLPPHHALRHCVSWALSPRYLAGLKPCPRPGSRFTPLESIVFAPTGEEPGYRPGRIKGPATVTLRYPARIKPAQVPRGSGRDPERRRAAAKRLEVEAMPARSALVVGTEIRLPAGKEIVFK